MNNNCTVELLLNPCCVCERDYVVVEKICERCGVPLTVFNLWDIDDTAALPKHIAQIITGRRNGEIGFRAVMDGRVAGQLIYMPKTAARRICLPICPTREAEAETLVVVCLLVFREFRRQGVASALIRSLIELAEAHDYHRIEANVSLKLPSDADLEHISCLPFKSAGFLIDETSVVHSDECGPYYTGNRMCYYAVR